LLFVRLREMTLHDFRCLLLPSDCALKDKIHQLSFNKYQGHGLNDSSDSLLPPPPIILCVLLELDFHAALKKKIPECECHGYGEIILSCL
jgi:hypothetical protein